MKKKKILCILLAVILLSGISSFSLGVDNTQNMVENNITNNNEIIQSNNLDELNQQKNETQEKLEEVVSQLEYVQEEMSAILLEIQKLDDKIRQYEQENQNLETKLQNLETSVRETTDQLAIIIEDYNKKEQQLKNRLVTMYEAGEVSYLDVLLSADSLSDFLSIYYAMIEMAEYDNALIDKVAEQKKQIEFAKKKLENETVEIKELKAKAEQSEVVLKNTKTLQEGYITRLSEEEQKINEQIQEYKNDMQRIEMKIQEISNVENAINIQYTGGTMLWPVATSRTVITSYYGTREHPIEGIIKFHQGLDIGGTGYGAPAVAALDGVVTYAGWLGSYGNCVMIYHGDGITTLYGHGQKVVTQRGAEVKQGDVILEIGSTGNSTGPHLHFEVRINGHTTNPLNYVKAP